MLKIFDYVWKALTLIPKVRAAAKFLDDEYHIEKIGPIKLSVLTAICDLVIATVGDDEEARKDSPFVQKVLPALTGIVVKAEKDIATAQAAKGGG